MIHTMRYPASLLILTLFLVTPVVSAQFYDTGQDPASLKWMQIKTGRFTVIYPDTYGSGGIAFAQSLEEAYSKLGSLYPEKKFRIPVVIHNYTTQSNGYVAWAPKRMEIYPTPEQNTIPLDPYKQLAIHELTHVLQMESLNRGFSKAMSLFLGEQFTGITAFLLPLWFLEGDAVFAESVLTESGRGRSPAFQKQLKAISVENGSMHKYDKIANGSFRDYVPDHYQSGYQMVSWSMAKYDPQIWNNVLKYTANLPFTINPVNLSLNKSAGLTKKKLFEESFDSLKTIWTQGVSDDNAVAYESINPSKKGKYINYYSPVIAGSDTIIAIKTSLSGTPAFVLINSSEKSEKKIHTPGQMYPWVISYANGKLVWVETQYDARWENREYSVIKLLDINTKTVSILSRKSRYLSASVSPDGKKVVAIENTISNKNNLVLIDAATGFVRQIADAPANAYLQRPKWSEDGEKITVIFLTESGEGIMSYTSSTRQWETLIEAGRDDLQSSVIRNDSLFFISSVSGTENVYLLGSAGRRIRLTRSRFGAIDLCLAGGKVFFSDYTSIGNNICSTRLADASKNTDDNVTSSSFLINRFMNESQTSENASTTLYSPESYKKWKHLFKFHSWMPFYADIEEIKADPASVRPGVTLMSQNHLSTLISSVSYEFSQEKNHVLHSRITWKGWYPVFESQLDYGNEAEIDNYINSGENATDPSIIKPGIRFANTVYLPLRYSSGRFSEYLQPSIRSEYMNDYVYIKDEGSYDYGQTVLSGRVYFSNYHRAAYRDIYPRWAQTFDLNYSFAPFDRDIYGKMGTLKTSFYFPGILPDNGIKIRFEKEKQSPEKYLFSNRVPFPRGYKNIKSEDFELYSIDYVMPLAYPDFNIASLLYMKRIRIGLFYDYVSGPGSSFYEVTSSGLTPMYDNSSNKSFKSFGFELLADLHIFRIPYMISGGVQTAWKNFNEKPVFELLLNIDIFGMSIGRGTMQPVQ